jgi:hypothetical protein
VLRKCRLKKENFFPVGNPYKSLSTIQTAGDLFSKGTPCNPVSFLCSKLLDDLKIQVVTCFISSQEKQDFIVFIPE